jgi:hypothetical protein
MAAAGKKYTPPKDVNLEYVNIEFSGVEPGCLALSRADGISRGLNELGSSPEMRTAMMQLYEMVVGMVKELAESVLNEMVYGSLPPEVVDKKTNLYPPNEGKERTYRLMDSVVEGIQATDYGVFIGVDESYYTDGIVYWMAVEKGHQVLMPKPNRDGSISMVRTGGFVEGRPFMETIHKRVESEILPKVAAMLSTLPSLTAEIAMEIIKGAQQPGAVLSASHSKLYGSQYAVPEDAAAPEAFTPYTQGESFSLGDWFKSSKPERGN